MKDGEIEAAKANGIIYTGRITNWQEVGGNDPPMNTAGEPTGAIRFFQPVRTMTATIAAEMGEV